MAKKKGKREEGFTFPKFDGEEYRVKEVRDSKVTLFAVFYAIPQSLTIIRIIVFIILIIGTIFLLRVKTFKK